MANQGDHEEGFPSDQRDVEQLKADLFGIDDDEEPLEPEPEPLDDVADEDVDGRGRQSDASDEDVGVKRKRGVVESDDEAGGSEQKRAKHRDSDEQARNDDEFEDEDHQPLEEEAPPEDEDDDVPAEAAEQQQDGAEEEEGHVETAEDREFIDDEGVAPEDQYGGEDEDVDALPIPEAEEAEEGEEDELEAMLKNKRRGRKGEDLGTIEREMSVFLAEMDMAAEEDMEAHRNKRPALSKLKMLKRVEDFLAKVTYHDEFLRQGGLGSIKAWLQYYEDGTLPHLRVRSSMLRILDKLPINTMYEEHKQLLAKSLVGQLVMFCYKCPDEAMDNQRLAKALVEKWSKPIFEAAQADQRLMQDNDEMERLEARKQRKQLEQQQEAERDKELQARKNIKRGQPGYRIHAAIPQPAKLDYVRQPESMVVAMDNGDRGGKKEASRFDRKVRQISRNKNAGGIKAANVSVQGRGIYMLK